VKPVVLVLVLAVELSPVVLAVVMIRGIGVLAKINNIKFY